jgi:hypothetical protein
MTANEDATCYLRRFLDAYERHDFDTMWTFRHFAVLERFGIEESWESYKSFMLAFADLFGSPPA